MLLEWSPVIDVCEVELELYRSLVSVEFAGGAALDHADEWG
jgi:hypothetical protein